MEGKNSINVLKIERESSGTSVLSLQDHVKGLKKTIRKNGELYEVQYFENEYAEQYTVRKVGDAEVKLYENGVLLQVWNETNGKRNGNCTQYELGMVKQMQNWENLSSDGDVIRVLNTKAGSLVEFIDRTSGIVVYRGEYDKLIHRHGRGVEFDRLTGRELYEGYWKSGRLERVLKAFRANRMTEFRDESNVDVATRVPTYIGGYLYNQESNSFCRNGHGCSIDPVTRIAIREEEWDNGERVRTTELVNGWYKEPLTISSSALWRATVMSNEFERTEKVDNEGTKRISDQMKENERMKTYDQSDLVNEHHQNNQANSYNSSNSSMNNDRKNEIIRNESISDQYKSNEISEGEEEEEEEKVTKSEVVNDKSNETREDIKVDVDKNMLNRSSISYEETFSSSDELIGIGSSSEEDEPCEIIIHTNSKPPENYLNLSSSNRTTKLARPSNSLPEMESEKIFKIDSSDSSDSSDSGVYVADSSDELYF